MQLRCGLYPKQPKHPKHPHHHPGPELHQPHCRHPPWGRNPNNAPVDLLRNQQGSELCPLRGSPHTAHSPRSTSSPPRSILTLWSAPVPSRKRPHGSRQKSHENQRKARKATKATKAKTAGAGPCQGSKDWRQTGRRQKKLQAQERGPARMKIESCRRTLYPTDTPRLASHTVGLLTELNKTGLNCMAHRQHETAGTSLPRTEGWKLWKLAASLTPLTKTSLQSHSKRTSPSNRGRSQRRQNVWQKLKVI
mmetsp:Transcript_32093/g.73884  ORF Transcript_32093/g.73884 Transcript_32093/m.73884 type:complete len:250 (-) Transcript_32093:2382-3131(-)